MLQDVRTPALDPSGWQREVQERYDGMVRECEDESDAPCPLLSEFVDFVREIGSGRFRPAGSLAQPEVIDTSDHQLSGVGLVALLALKKNMWVWYAYTRNVGWDNNLELWAWYVEKARVLSLEMNTIPTIDGADVE